MTLDKSTSRIDAFKELIQYVIRMVDVNDAMTVTLPEIGAPNLVSMLSSMANNIDGTYLNTYTASFNKKRLEMNISWLDTVCKKYNVLGLLCIISDKGDITIVDTDKKSYVITDDDYTLESTHQPFCNASNDTVSYSANLMNNCFYMRMKNLPSKET